MEDNMRPTTAFDDNVFGITALLHPGTVFDHPKDVLADPSLSVSEKRAILASWASDASAIASCPALRAPAGLKAPVSIDTILEALCELDGGPRNPPGGTPKRRFSTARAWSSERDRSLRLRPAQSCGPRGIPVTVRRSRRAAAAALRAD